MIASLAIKPTTAMYFVDTNILLYAVSTAEGELSKRKRALTILDRRDLALSVQVLQEFYVQATRPSKPQRLTHEQATSLIEAFCRFPVLEVSLALVRDALAVKERFAISYWDAAIVAAARMLECSKVLSEDLNHGQSFDGVVVENPFLG
jgi:predicted nucleic acid-binding protein